MRAYMLTHLSDATLLRDLTELVAQDRTTTAALLAHVAEVDARKLYLGAGYPSMFAYCVGELRLSEDAAFKRIKAARAARRCPAIFEALAQGRVHLSAVVLLAPHLREDSADELLVAATHKSKAEVEQLLAERFPRTEMLAWLDAIPASSPTRLEQQAPGPVETDLPPMKVQAPPVPEPPGSRSRVTPLAPKRFALQVTVSQSTHDKLRYAQALLSHQVPSRDISAVLDRALDALIFKLEKRKFAATQQPRPRRRAVTGRRNVPAHVKRAVWERDQGQCTFVGATGHRCAARSLLEFDHVDLVARGGQATVERMRLRCRAHNQYAAELAFGSGFMIEKRNQARRAASEPRRRAAAEARRAAVREQAANVLTGLRELGFRAEEARRAVEFGATLENATLEERMRAALKFLGGRPCSSPSWA